MTDTANHFGVSVQGDSIVILMFQQRLSREQALNLAAWLVALADQENQFPKLLEAVQNTGNKTFWP